jgi:hypothetical protein
MLLLQRSESDNTQKGLLPDPILPKESLMKTPLVKHLCQQNPECKYFVSDPIFPKNSLKNPLVK